ncbi:hypothetical protein CCMA1212_002211 [Trichoderma ghanense]|uniref:Uncharacterized protein n=1 Tax=Trichoderma ghanense TaxID=65468 RepID=A0ABY2HFL1_9HYPO
MANRCARHQSGDTSLIPWLAFASTPQYAALEAMCLIRYHRLLSRSLDRGPMIHGKGHMQCHISLCLSDPLDRGPDDLDAELGSGAVIGARASDEAAAY